MTKKRHHYEKIARRRKLEQLAFQLGLTPALLKAFLSSNGHTSGAEYLSSLS